jgi:translation elongation factor EF-4
MLKNGSEVKVDNPTELPDEGVRDHLLEPYVKCEPC